MKKPGRRANRGREQWRALVAEWKASGSTAKEFARVHGLIVSSLFYWSSTLQREPPPTGTAARLVPVRLTAPVHESRAELELSVGHVRVRFDSGAPPHYVAALARALLEARLMDRALLPPVRQSRLSKRAFGRASAEWRRR